MFKIRPTTLQCMLVAAISLWPRPGIACEFGYCWGAVGFGPGGITGFSVRNSNAPEAEKRAGAACGDKCTIIEVFHDSCAALVAGSEDSFQFGTGDSRAEAENNAREKCQALGEYCVTQAFASSM